MKKTLASMMFFLILLSTLSCISPAWAEETGILIIDATPNATLEFKPMWIEVARVTDDTEVTIWELNITEPEDIQLTAPAGTYKLYLQGQGHRTIWEIDNEGAGYTVSPLETTVVSVWGNPTNFWLKEVFADAPYRVQSGQIPILVMVKDAEGSFGPYDYDLGNVEIYRDDDCDRSNNEAEDTLLKIEEAWYGITVSDSFYNLYSPGDWYGITYLDPSEHGLSGEVCFHVVIRDIGGFLDPDDDTHSHFSVNIESENLPTLSNWHPGDVHYHSSYTDNLVEFGYPIEATAKAGAAMGLEWSVVTDHSFDVRDSRTSDSNHKWDTLKTDVTSYSTNAYKLILGEEVSCYGHETVIKIDPLTKLPYEIRGVVHLLVFGMDNFDNVRGTGLDFIPGCHDELDTPTWNLEDVVDIVSSQGGVCYAAHPEAHRDITAKLLDRVPWIIEDYDLARTYDYDATGYHGLQVWNGKWSQNDDWQTERDEGLSQWKRLLLNGHIVFVAGGSDAHGDFSQDLKFPQYEKSHDTAFGKVRTYVYTETLSRDSVLNALKNGQSVMTDGPLVVFDVTNELGQKATIGGKISGSSFVLNVEWNSSSEFGEINGIKVYRGVIGGNEEEIYSLSPNSFSGTQAYPNLVQEIPSLSYIRIEATSLLGGETFQCYTNPIWIRPRVSAAAKVNAVLVIDRSGSMSGSKIASAKTSAKLFTDLMQIGDRMGVVSYASSVTTNFQLSEITSTATKTAVKNSIDSIYASGSTAMGWGLRAGYNQLVSRGDPTQPWAIVLMSNGFHNYGEHPYNVIPDLKSKNIRVYTIGLGAGADGNLLGYIASQTGGFYRYSPTPEQLLEIYNDIFAAVTQSQTVSTTSGAIAQGQTFQSSVNIDSSITQATFTISWGGSDLDLTLIQPDGSIIDPDVAATDSDVEYVEEAQYEFYRISNPMVGTWTMIVTGVDVPIDTEDFVAKVSAVSNVTMSLTTDKDNYVYPEPVRIVATLQDGSIPIIGADAQATVTRPDASQVSLHLFDDGSSLHGDVVADDGIYTNYFASFSEDGSYTIQVTAYGLTFTGEPFSRENQKTVLISGVPTDTSPPTTTMFVDLPQYTDALGNLYVTSDTSFTLSAVDNHGAGSGVTSIRYRVHNATYDTGWIVAVPSITFQLTGLGDGSYSIDYHSTDNAGNVEPINTANVILDNTEPGIIVLNPPPGWALQDVITFIASSSDSSGTRSLNFSIREANGDQGIPVGFEDMPTTYNTTTGKWNWSFNTLQLPDGFYIVLVSAEDNLGHTASITIPYSIRNWAVIELLPSSTNNKAGRTMPVKFALRVAAEVDPNQPFVYNEELRIEIFATVDPDNVLQESYYGDTARDYRISSVLYVTNFKTIRRTPMEYTVAIYRDTFDVGSFTFETVK